VLGAPEGADWAAAGPAAATSTAAALAAATRHRCEVNRMIRMTASFPAMT
jgi:hypothetical protein